MGGGHNADMPDLESTGLPTGRTLSRVWKWRPRRYRRSWTARALGFEPNEVSSEYRGYDIESQDPDWGRLRFIEVKGRRAEARTLSITRNEMLAAFNAADSIILAVVLVDRALVHRPFHLPNPAPVLGPEPGFSEVSRAISAEALKRTGRGE